MTTSCIDMSTIKSRLYETVSTLIIAQLIVISTPLKLYNNRAIVLPWTENDASQITYFHVNMTNLFFLCRISTQSYASSAGAC